MNTTEIGNFFEEKCMQYLKHMYPTREVYLLRDTPEGILRTTKIGKNDIGVDIIMVKRTHYKAFNYAVQCKWRSNRKYNFTFSDLSTFFASASDFNGGMILMTNCDNISKRLRKKIEMREHNFEIITYKSFEEIDLDVSRKGLPIVKEIINRHHTMYSFQQEAVNAAIAWYEGKYKRGKIIMACGTGKTFISLKIIETLNCNNVLIIVPSLYLLNQFYSMYKNQSNVYTNFILIGSFSEIQEEDERINVITTTKENIIRKKIDMFNDEKLVIISTYASAIKFAPILANKFNWIPDITIYDEAHKLCSIHKNSRVGFHDLLMSIKSKKKMFMTATEKLVSYNSEIIDPMSNKKMFGVEIFKYDLGTAIVDKTLCNYQIINSYHFVENEKLNNLMKSNTVISNATVRQRKQMRKHVIEYRSQVSAAIIKKFILNGTFDHILTYHGTIERANIFMKFFKANTQDIKNKLFTSVVTGKTSRLKRIKILDDFTKSEWGLLASVRVFNEGVDIPCVNGICFVDPRMQMIDIIQCIGRALRNYENKTISTIITPVHASFLNKEETYNGYKTDTDFLLQLMKTIEFFDESVDKRASRQKINTQNHGRRKYIVNKFRQIHKHDIIDNHELLTTDTAALIPSGTASYFNEIMNSIEVNVLSSMATRGEKWMKNFNKLKEFIEKFNILPRAPTNSIRRNQGEKSLYEWCTLQQERYKSQNIWKIHVSQLNTLTLWKWTKNINIMKVWNENLTFITNFVSKQYRYPIKSDGIEHQRMWFFNARRDMNAQNLTSDQYTTLKHTIELCTEKITWESKFNELKTYMHIHNYLPTKSTNAPLYNWIMFQKMIETNGFLSKERKEKIDSIIQITWFPKDTYDDLFNKLSECVNKSEDEPIILDKMLTEDYVFHKWISSCISNINGYITVNESMNPISQINMFGEIIDVLTNDDSMISKQPKHIQKYKELEESLFLIHASITDFTQTTKKMVNWLYNKIINPYNNDEIRLLSLRISLYKKLHNNYNTVNNCFQNITTVLKLSGEETNNTSINNFVNNTFKVILLKILNNKNYINNDLTSKNILQFIKSTMPSEESTISSEESIISSEESIISSEESTTSSEESTTSSEW